VRSLNTAAATVVRPKESGSNAAPTSVSVPRSRTDNTDLIRKLEAESQGIRRLKETHNDHIEHDRPLARRLAGGADNC